MLRMVFQPTLVIACLGCLSTFAVAQNATIMRLYGTGVHRYFSGDCQGALEALTEAVELGAQDPRVYFYRGLARECLGQDGQEDFATGAELEAKGKLVVNVDRALERIQGSVRVRIQQLRIEARIQAEKERMAAEQKRRAKAAELAKHAANQPPPPPAETDPTDPVVAGLRADQTVVEGKPPAVAEINSENPFGAVAGVQPASAATEGSANTQPSAPAATASDPFGTAPTGGDPFGSDPFAPAASGSGSQPGSSQPANPFGADPFGSGN